MQLGIDVDAYTYRARTSRVGASAVVRYALQPARQRDLDHLPVLHEWPATPCRRDYQGVDTHAAHEMAAITRIAEAYGLYVAFRPLLDEASIGYGFRGNMRPRNPARWFASYRRFLLPYAKRRSVPVRRSSSSALS